MAADLPENYEKQPGVPVHPRRRRGLGHDARDRWHASATTSPWHGAKRGGQTWFVGAITDEEARTFDVPLAFLTPGKRYVAEIYADGPEAHWLDNPLPVAISRRAVTSTTRLRVALAPGGGQAIRIRPAK